MDYRISRINFNTESQIKEDGRISQMNTIMEHKLRTRIGTRISRMSPCRIDSSTSTHRAISVPFSQPSDLQHLQLSTSLLNHNPSRHQRSLLHPRFPNSITLQSIIFFPSIAKVMMVRTRCHPCRPAAPGFMCRH